MNKPTLFVGRCAASPPPLSRPPPADERMGTRGRRATCWSKREVWNHNRGGFVSAPSSSPRGNLLEATSSKRVLRNSLVKGTSHSSQAPRGKASSSRTRQPLRGELLEASSSASASRLTPRGRLFEATSSREPLRGKLLETTSSRQAPRGKVFEATSPRQALETTSR